LPVVVVDDPDLPGDAPEPPGFDVVPADVLDRVVVVVVDFGRVVVVVVDFGRVVVVVVDFGRVVVVVDFVPVVVVDFGRVVVVVDFGRVVVVVDFGRVVVVVAVLPVVAVEPDDRVVAVVGFVVALVVGLVDVVAFGTLASSLAGVSSRAGPGDCVVGVGGGEPGGGGIRSSRRAYCMIRAKTGADTWPP
jgi:hypothetical protein